MGGANQDVVTEVYLANSLSKVLGKQDRSWLSSIDKTVLMMCFVKERNLKQNSDVLFWSHYADAGRGVCITFNLEERPRGGLYYMKEVEYADEVPVFDCGLMKEWMQSPVFFCQVRAECGTLCWPDDIDVDPESVWEDASKNRC